MNTPATCPQCSSTLPADAPEGLCPACLMRGGLDTDATIKMTPSQKPSAAEPMPTPLPEELAPLFPQLEILELLGRGGMGTVYKARQMKLNRFVALKIISAEAGADPHFAERFQREAQALAKLNHPHIVSVFDFGETGGLFYFLMEYVDGANLRTLIRSGEMKPEAALALIPAFCDALQYAHDEGVVHRDIKPENVLVDKKGRVKIADFGLAKLLGQDANDHTLTRTGMYLGTPRYMAPEQVDRPDSVDHRADIYSLGVVFYEMLTGEIPMGRFAPPSQKVQVDVRFDEIVLHALERDVALRYQHASEIKTDVEGVTSTPRPPAAAVSSASPAMVAPARVDEAEPPAAMPLPSFFWLRAFALLMLGWLVVGALWNFCTPGCLLGALVMGIIVIELALRHARQKPVWAQTWRDASAWGRVYFAGSFIVLAVLPFMLTISAMDVKWETSSLRWNLMAQSKEAFETAHKGKEYQLIRGLDAFKDEVPATELVPSAVTWFGGWQIWGDNGPHHNLFGWLSIIASFCSVTLILTFMIQQVLGAEKFSVWRIGTSGWRPALALTCTMLASVVCAYAALNFCYITSSTGGKGKFTATPVMVAATPRQVEMALHKWAAENGYARGDDNRWSVDTVPKGQRVAEVALFNAWKASPFDRWQMTWSGLRQITPHVTVQTVGTDKPLQTMATYSGSMMQFDAQETALFEGVMKSLAEAISNATAMDVKKPLEEQIVRKPAGTPTASNVSPWLLFFGVVGLAVLWSVLRHGRQGKAAGAALSSEPRLSRCALWGAILAPFGLLLLPAFFTTRTVSSSDANGMSQQPQMTFMILLGVLFVISLAAPIGTTILGAVSLGHIKRSGGKLYGLPLAFADVVLFPMLLLHGGMAVLLGLLIVSIVKIAGVNAGIGLLELGLLAMLPLIADFFIVRALWRKVAGKPASNGGDIGSKLNLAAVGLLLAGIVNALAGLAWIGLNVNTLVAAAKQGAPMAEPVVMLLLSLGSIAVVYYTIGSALFLMHRKDDGDITFPLIMAALVPPGCIFGLPAAIYALVLLSKPEAKALFPQAKPESDTL
ncbi:serine/threonine-protein kinase [Prosthecobacter sp.]|uniref:serine/threonine-protein kinase n=1 Tax=Prosthecobacter sp. TaxID=1965333 RepID=UPI002ABBCEBD|nr:serine/threonine-protein kinase [Prosthecobacter sp.]MDZ4401795.1 serine/threonine-protein kinase [Prosthecobacter sp.]